MSAETADLTKVDSAVSGLSSSPTEEKKGHRRASSSAAGVYNINDLGALTIQSNDPKGYQLVDDDHLTDTLHREGRERTPNSERDSEIELVCVHPLRVRRLAML